MPVTTFSAAVHITPTVFKTFFKHTKEKGWKLYYDREDEATDDLFYDEAFHIVKDFINLGCNNTVESLQAFTNTHVPSPPWATVCPVRVPLSTCNRAADVLIDWFGPDELRDIVGGERWWQVRGLDGIDAEWVTENEYLSPEKPHATGLSETDRDILRMEDLQSVMLYVHGGGYFWGSINTHRYQIIRYARQIHGRAFAINYRKAPQYPWPCPLHDVLAAYFYLIQPPSDALHKPISPSKIVFAGDSAGAGLCLTALTVLRDMGHPLPAGAVLISPWVDLTHSMPSVMQNTATDIIPEHGFLSEPSTLWPLDPLPPPGTARVSQTEHYPPPEPGHADTLRPESERVSEQKKRVEEGKAPWRKTDKPPSQEAMIGTPEEGPDTKQVDGKLGTFPSDQTSSTIAGDVDLSAVKPEGERNIDIYTKENEDEEIDRWQPKPPKVLMKDPKEIPLELHSQIQTYALNEQLTHPLVSPILQGSLGNLCPLYIIAGDGEVLRDEIIRIAHRAAHPEDYPTRAGVLRDAHRQRENAEKFKTPTKVHLQVFDGMCHVLTVFSFTTSAKYAYRSITEFVKHVTTHDQEHLGRNPFPELHRPDMSVSDQKSTGKISENGADEPEAGPESAPPVVVDHEGKMDREGAAIFKENTKELEEEIEKGSIDQAEPIQSSPFASVRSLAGSSHLASSKDDIANVAMIRERVDIYGHVRPMESREDMVALQVSPSEIGLIKEEPCRRWADGQAEWDKKFKHKAQKVYQQRRQCVVKAKRMLDSAIDEGLDHSSVASTPQLLKKHSYMRRLSFKRTTSASEDGLTHDTSGKIQQDRRWGPLDLSNEHPPPSAIAARLDTPEAVALLKKHLYFTAPRTHRIIPRMKMIDTIRAAFDPHDDPYHAPQQSVSEQQVHTNIVPEMHGLRIWDVLLGYFVRKSTRKATNSVRGLASSVGLTNEPENEQC